MSNDQNNAHSSPTSSGRLFLRVILIGALVVVGVIGMIWYSNR